MGVVASRRGILTPPVLSALSRVVVSIFLPAILFSNILTSMAAAPLATMAALPTAAACQMAVGVALASALRPALRLPRDGSSGLAGRVFLVLCMFGNSAALPLLFGAALFAGAPASAAAYVSGVSFFLLGWSPMFWSLGYELLTSTPGAAAAAGGGGGSGGGGGGGGGKGGGGGGGGRLLKRILTPPVVASFAAVVVGAIPALRGLLIAPGGGAPLGLALAAARSLGAGYAPTAVLVLAGSLAAPAAAAATAPAVAAAAGAAPVGAATGGGAVAAPFPGSAPPPPAPPGAAAAVQLPVVRLALGVALVRLLLLPAVTLASLSALKAAGVVLPPMVQLVILVEAAMPPAQNSVLMLHKEGQPATAAAVARVLLLVYVAAIVPVAVGLSIFLVVSGV